MDGHIFWMGYDNLIYEYTLKYLYQNNEMPKGDFTLWLL